MAAKWRTAQNHFFVFNSRYFSSIPIRIADLKKEGKVGQVVTVQGWLRTIRLQKTMTFLNINDGSCLSGVQSVLQSGVDNLNLKDLTTGSCAKITGKLVNSPKGQMEIEMEDLQILGGAENTYPLQKKAHSLEFLRDMTHLRCRTNTISGVLRVRSSSSKAIHDFFAQRHFLQVHTPILTSNDCEGAGELFLIDKSNEFFGNNAFLTVSGQLHAEMFASGLSKVYTFGPTFRAENSSTKHHLAEFWMLEPEICFVDQNGLLELAESCFKFIVNRVREECEEDLIFFTDRNDRDLLPRLEKIQRGEFARMTYTKAIQILSEAPKSFQVPPVWGVDLTKEHERYLAEDYCKVPVFITNYPKQIKPFYMKCNDDTQTVQALDLLVPHIGELIGGSMREDNYDLLKSAMEKHNLLQNGSLSWYLDLRKYGSAPHGGWGLGFDRLILYLTGLDNIRDVSPVPRVTGNCRY